MNEERVSTLSTSWLRLLQAASEAAELSDLMLSALTGYAPQAVRAMFDRMAEETGVRSREALVRLAIQREWIVAPRKRTASAEEG